ncbi:hypothetical protein HOG16_05045 [Candidatus Woesearchaeota archaeon]|jgi:hypothetical protein|nr:hypothetical protein [archaeon]MBT3691576.1 hypothetical protein [Candidatus Woesearchaeota archaeon]MBT4373524.1 hypothetical protein [archaeon]MBT4531972.1 hypothetical protein [archaeon]MBT7001639.1 hypothetical protein [archaeon]
MNNKKGMGRWIWVIIALIFITGIGIYFWLTGHPPVQEIENSISTPPLLPS